MPSEIKVLHTESSIGWGGQELRTVAEMKAASLAGYAPILVCDSQSQFLERSGLESTSVIKRNINRKSLASLFRMMSVLRSIKPSLIISHSSTDSWLVAIARLLLCSPIPWIRMRHVSARVDVNPLTRWMYKSSNIIVTTSDEISAEIQKSIKLPEYRVISVPTGVDQRMFAPGSTDAQRDARSKLGLSSSEFVIAMVATLRSWKGHRFMIEALRGFPEIKLVIAGDGPQRQNLGDLADRYGLAKQIIFTGYLADPRPVLQAADCFIQPSTGNEGVSQSLLQAMAMELPVIVSDIGGLNQAVKNEFSGLLVAPGSVKQLVSAINLIKNDSVLRTRLGQNARKIVLSSHSLEQMWSRMNSLYKRVIDGSN